MYRIGKSRSYMILKRKNHVQERKKQDVHDFEKEKSCTEEKKQDVHDFEKEKSCTGEKKT